MNNNLNIFFDNISSIIYLNKLNDQIEVINDFFNFFCNIKIKKINAYDENIFILKKHLKYKFKMISDKNIVSLLNNLMAINELSNIMDPNENILIINNTEGINEIKLFINSLNNDIYLSQIINNEIDIVIFNNSLNWYIIKKSAHIKIKQLIVFSDPIENSYFMNKNIECFNDFISKILTKKNYNTPLFNEDYLINNCKQILNAYSQNCIIDIKTICTMSTESNIIELKLFLMSLNLFWSGIIYIMCDSFVDNWIKNNLNSYNNLIIISVNKLDKYNMINTKSQQDNNKKNEWLNLMLEKTHIIDHVLSNTEVDGVLFLDSDIVILHELPKIPDADVILSIHNGNKAMHKQVGFFNGGCIYVKNKKFPQWWRETTLILKNKVYMEQGTLSHIENNFTFGVFTDQFNFGAYRYFFDDELNIEEKKKKLNCDEINLLYDNKPLISIHTHFFCKNANNYTVEFNNIILTSLINIQNENFKLIYKYITSN